MGSGEDSNYSSSFDQSSAEREEYSVTYTQAFSEKSSWFWGYYESYADLYHMRETDIFGIDYTFHFDTEIETGGLFLGASTNDRSTSIRAGTLEAHCKLTGQNFLTAIGGKTKMAKAGASHLAKT